MTTTTGRYPEIPVPAGVAYYDSWDDWSNECRLLWGTRREVKSTNLSVMPSVAQLPDGSIQAGDRLIHIDAKESAGFRDCLTVDASGARLLAQALIDAADQIDRWAAEGTTSS